MKTKFEMQNEVRKLKEQQAALEKKIEEIESLEDEYQLADFLHSKLCKHNHTDGCGYHYKKWSDTPLEYSRKEYLAKAIKLMQYCDVDSIVELVDILTERMTSEEQSKMIESFIGG